MVKGTCRQVLVQMVSIPVLLSIPACSSGFTLTATKVVPAVKTVVTPVAPARPVPRDASRSIDGAPRTNGSPLQMKADDLTSNAVPPVSAARPDAAGREHAVQVVAMLPASEPAEQIGQMATVVESVRLRAGPGTNTASYGTLVPDTQVKVLGQQADWYKVLSPRGTLGWLAAGYVALNTNAIPPDPGALARANAAVRIAERYVGAPYLWGGASPHGFDCSGFTQYVYRQLGVRLPRRARQQFDTSYGAVIDSLANLAPGDLVFFDHTTEESGITHVGIFVGAGRMIAARTDVLGVRYVNVYEPFWRIRFVGGLRIAR